jgi:hypothetical protein
VSPSVDTASIVVTYLDPTTGFVPACTPNLATCKQVTVSFNAFNPASASTGYAGKTFVLVGTRRITS